MNTTSGEGDQRDHLFELFQTSAQAVFPPSECPDTPRKWGEILGNASLIRTHQAFASPQFAPRSHILAYGANRSAKTWTAHLSIQTKFCRKRDASLNPCQECVSCLRWRSGAGYRNGMYFNGTQSFEYLGVNCHDLETFDENKVLGPRGSDCPLVLFLDEVASPTFSPIIPKLLKPMMELPMAVIACGVRIKSIRDKKTGKAKSGLPPDFRFRFPNIVKTTTVPQEPFLAWLRRQCAIRTLRVDDPEALDLIRQKSFSIPGQALRPLDSAKFLGVPISRTFVEEFRWDAE